MNFYQWHGRLEAFIFKNDFDYTDQWMMIVAIVICLAVVVGIVWQKITKGNLMWKRMWNKMLVLLVAVWVVRVFYSDYELIRALKELSIGQTQAMRICKDGMGVTRWYLIYPEEQKDLWE